MGFLDDGDMEQSQDDSQLQSKLADAAAASRVKQSAAEKSGNDLSNCEDGEEAAGSEQSRVVLILQTKQGKRSSFRVAVDAPLSRLFDHFAQLEHSSLAGSKPSFWLDGDRISPESTPDDLDIEDDTVIDVQC